MKKYIAPELTLVSFTQANIIATSLGTLDSGNTITNPTDVCARRRGFSSEDEWDDEDF